MIAALCLITVLSPNQLNSLRCPNPSVSGSIKSSLSIPFPRFITCIVVLYSANPLSHQTKSASKQQPEQHTSKHIILPLKPAYRQHNPNYLDTAMVGIDFLWGFLLGTLCSILAALIWRPITMNILWGWSNLSRRWDKWRESKAKPNGRDTV